MPLSFPSTNRGNIAFGFFNIESDMLLLQEYFFFADDFCGYIAETAEHRIWNQEKRFKVYKISDPAKVGDLMGAIHGIRYSGFIGEIYRAFPFPENPAQFKQKTDGCKNRDLVREKIEPYAESIEIEFLCRERLEIQIGSYIFDRLTFHKLLRYVEQGGFPRWENEMRPEYVDIMKKRLEKSVNEMFDGLVF